MKKITLVAATLTLLACTGEDPELIVFCDYMQEHIHISQTATKMFGGPLERSDSDQSIVADEFRKLRASFKEQGHPKILTFYMRGLENGWLNNCREQGYKF